MTNEDIVRKYWKDVYPRWKDNDSYAPDLFIVELGDTHYSDKDPNVVWLEAREDTQKRVEELRIAKKSLYHNVDRLFDLDIHNYVSGLLQDRIATLKEGMINV